jgi:hypothetical protein
MNTIINTGTPLGGAIYPFLQRLERRWVIVRQSPESPVIYSKAPTLRWVNGEISDLYVEGMDTAQFLAASGLELSLEKGGFVLSKRISRIMRPHFISGFFAKDEIKIQYLDLDERGQKIWDGAGRVSRSLLLRLIDKLPEGISPAKRRQLQYELKHARRVEFTVMTDSGQEKGHACVMDDLDADFILPPDTKTQVKLTGDNVFVGIHIVHGAREMRLDIQSLINLHPFFDVPQLQQWLADEGALFLQAVQSDINPIMSRIDPLPDADNRWYLQEYFMSGGSAMWFGSVVKAVINQHIKRLNHTTLGKMRLPVPGGRAYVMVDKVGDKSVPSGQITIDKETAWVNQDDWYDTMADVLGGADQDDALWLFPFADFDGEHKVLCWRSPNQVGEYVVLKPTTDSDTLAWETTGEAVIYPTADSRLLPPRIDTVTVDYLNLVDESENGTDQAYSISAMQTTIDRAISNDGVLGGHCNLLMVSQAVYGRLPKQPPAALETIIDASVKTGADLSRVRKWCIEATGKIIAQQKPIPAVLHERIRSDRGSPPLVQSDDHWLDNLVEVIIKHVVRMTAERDALMTRTMPPLALFQQAFERPELLHVGAQFNRLHTTALSGRRYELARQRSEAFLDSQADRDGVLLGALAHYYLNPQHKGLDAAAWQLGERDEVAGGRKAGIAQMTIQALRAIGVLDEIYENPDSLYRTYPGAVIHEPKNLAIQISGTWFNWYRAYLQSRGQPLPEIMRDVSNEQKVWAKAQVTRLAQTQFRNMQLTVCMEGGRKIAYTEAGNLFGYIARVDNDTVSNDTITIRFGVVKDGNLRCIIQQ